MLNRAETQPPPKFLEAMGWLAIRWSGLELMIEICCAYLFHYRSVLDDVGVPPRPFRSRVRFIRRAMRHPAFAHLRHDYEKALETAEGLAEERNDRMHGAFTSWAGPGDPMQTVIRSFDFGYIATQDRPVSITELDDLSERIGKTFFVHFNLIDRMKAIVRSLEGNKELGRKMIGGA